ncbi:MAG: hypothetical protein Q9182_006264 [Xanthomendoza sp. 2 TL-2023]
MGALYGANLKGSRDVAKHSQKRQDASPEEILDQLNSTRNKLVAHKTELEKKIAQLEKKRNGANVNEVSRAES